MLGILIPDGLREPNDAFVIAHRGYVVWDHRRHRPYASGLDVWHRITSSKSGTIKRRRRMSRFSDADERSDLAAAYPIAILLRPKRATNRCSHVISAPYRCGARAGYFVLCKPRRLCYTLPLANPWFRLFLGSSAVEHSTVNRMVAGSNPARGAKQIKYLAGFRRSCKNPCVGIVLANELPPCPVAWASARPMLCRADFEALPRPKAGWSLYESRKAAGEYGFCGLVKCRVIPAAAWGASVSAQQQPPMVYVCDIAAESRSL
jgi:hypothetical protein